MIACDYDYYHESLLLRGFLAYKDAPAVTQRPAVLIAHDWTGRNSFACQKAQWLAELGYVAFAVDMYGCARNGVSVDEKMQLMQPLIEDRALLAARMLQALDVVCQLPQVDNTRIGALGFCFGGLCVLDLARSGAPIKAVVSCHGLLNKPENVEDNPIKSQVLVLHGYDDPMVRPADVSLFCDEMNARHADWQVHLYGHTQHAFTNPEAHDSQMGTVYNALANKRALQAVTNFFDEALG